VPQTQPKWATCGLYVGHHSHVKMQSFWNLSALFTTALSSANFTMTTQTVLELSYKQTTVNTTLDVSKWLTFKSRIYSQVKYQVMKSFVLYTVV